MVRRLLDCGASVDGISTTDDEDDETSLVLAARGGHLDVLKPLLERGANPNGDSYVSPLEGACRREGGGRPEIVKVL